jgi:hypothetical protein
MFDYKEMLQAMRGERASMQAELDKLDEAIAAIDAVVDHAAPTRTKPKLPIKSRRRISETQKERWARLRQTNSAQEKKPGQARRRISAQGLRNIVEAQKKRWAKAKAAAKS